MIGLLLGGVMAWLALRSRTASLPQLSLREKELSAVKADLARLLEDQRALVESRARLESALESERKTSNEKIELLTKSSDRAADYPQMPSRRWRPMPSKAIILPFCKSHRKRSSAFSPRQRITRSEAESGGGSGAPVRDSLSKVDAQIQQMEKSEWLLRGTRRQSISITSQKELQSETGNLVRALRTPNVRGRWGEIQLRRVVEMFGMPPIAISPSRKQSRAREAGSS